jgi:hypothetical protein
MAEYQPQGFDQITFNLLDNLMRRQLRLLEGVPPVLYLLDYYFE